MQPVEVASRRRFAYTFHHTCTACVNPENKGGGGGRVIFLLKGGGVGGARGIFTVDLINLNFSG